MVVAVYPMVSQWSLQIWVAREFSIEIWWEWGWGAEGGGLVKLIKDG